MPTLIRPLRHLQPDASGPLTAEPAVMSPRREIARIAMPVSLEFVLTLVLNFLNQVIVGGLGAVALGAVGLANSLLFILLLTLGALGASSAILVARAHGAGRREHSDTVTTAAVVLSAIASAVVAAPAAFFAADLLRLTGASTEVTAAGAAYLALVVASLPFAVVAAVLSAVMRSTGYPRAPMVATAVTVAVNVPLAYGLVFGVGPLPAMGVPGAGVATLVAMALKVSVLAWQVFGHHHAAAWRLPRTTATWSAVLRPLFVLALPLGITELFWTTGTFLYNVVQQRISDEALAAAQIVNNLEGVFIVGSIGLMAATTALVGRSIGQGDAPAARDWVRRLSRAGIVTGLGFGVLFGLSVFAIEALFGNVGHSVQHIAVIGILINAVTQVVKVRNMIYGAGALPSGNDVRGVILGDTVGAFAVGLPLAVVLGWYTPLGVVGVFLARAVEETVKLAIFSWRMRRLDWDRLTREAVSA